MNRSILLILALVVALTGGTLARAGEAPTAPPIPLEDIELLPVHDLEWALLLHEHPDLIRRIAFLGKRIEKIHTHLESRANQDDAGAQKLKQEIGRLATLLAPHLEQLLDAARPLGIDDDVLAVLDDAPKGPRRLERHAVRIVLGLDLQPTQRAIFDALVPALDGALLTEHALAERLDDDASRAVLTMASDAQMKRFWRVVDATLDREQRLALIRRLPTKVAKVDDLLGHVYTLPGLTVSQGARIKALLVRLEQEAAPDKAVEERAKSALADDSISADERRTLEATKQQAEMNNVARMVEAWREGLAILTADQQAELRAILPRLSAKDRPGDLKEDFQGVAWLPEQMPMLVSLKQRFAPLAGEMQQRLAVLGLEAERMGPDAPEMEAMPMRQAQIYGELLAEARVAAHELFLEVMTPEQIVAWVLTSDR